MQTESDNRSATTQVHDKQPGVHLSPTLEGITSDIRSVVRPNLPLWTRPTGTFGVTLLRASFASPVLLQGTSTNHVIGVMDSPPVLTQHMMAGRRLEHQTCPGSICIGPAGADYSVEFLGPVSGLALEINTECLATLQVQSAAYERELVPRMDGFDAAISRFAALLEEEAIAGHSNGTLLWNSIADSLLHYIAENCCGLRSHTSVGALSVAALRRVEDYVIEHMAEPFDLDDLASVAGCDKFRFARGFKKCVGVSPHRFVVRKRIERARTLIATGRHSLAEVAASTGFSDQSHLHQWIKRILGVTPGQLVAARNRKNLQDGDCSSASL